MECPYCKESETKKIVDITVTFNFDNPKAISYPDVSRWHKDYHINICPMCGRKVLNDSEKDD